VYVALGEWERALLLLAHLDRTIFAVHVVRKIPLRCRGNRSMRLAAVARRAALASGSCGPGQPCARVCCADRSVTRCHGGR
jgi:hypothetical protein